MEKPTFTRANLSDVRVIMAIMHVLMDELLCQTVMGGIPLLKCMLLGARRRLWLHPIRPGIKWCCFLRPEFHGHLPGTGEPICMVTGGPGVCRVEA
jgi:hypothetical protein